MPFNASEVKQNRVALRLDDYDNQIYNHYWRDLHRHYEYTFNEQSRPEWLLSAESLELKINPGEESDVRKLNFTWSILDYTSKNIWI